MRRVVTINVRDRDKISKLPYLRNFFRDDSSVCIYEEWDGRAPASFLIPTFISTHSSYVRVASFRNRSRVPPDSSRFRSRKTHRDVEYERIALSDVLHRVASVNRVAQISN